MKSIDFFFFRVSIVERKNSIIAHDFVDELEFFIGFYHIYDSHFSKLADFRFIDEFWENEGAFFCKIFVNLKIFLKVLHQ